MKRFTCTALSPRATLYVYAPDATSAAIKAHRAGFTIGEVSPAGSYDAERNVIIEREAPHLNGKNGANGHHVNGGTR